MNDRYRKKPVVIDAVRWDGINVERVVGWVQDIEVSSATKLSFDLTEPPNIRPTITTLEGKMIVDQGDWIIRGVKGELYPCKPDIFEATYEPV